LGFQAPLEYDVFFWGFFWVFWGDFLGGGGAPPYGIHEIHLGVLT
jgi:hypothetical protein